MSDSENNKNYVEIGSVIEILIEYWRFLRLFNRVLLKLDAGESQRYLGQLRFSKKKIFEILENHDLTLVDLEGAAFETGMAVSALNLADFGENDRLLVDQMVEPVIMSGGNVFRHGTVLLKRIEE